MSFAARRLLLLGTNGQQGAALPADTVRYYDNDVASDGVKYYDDDVASNYVQYQTI